MGDPESFLQSINQPAMTWRNYLRHFFFESQPTFTDPTPIHQSIGMALDVCHCFFLRHHALLKLFGDFRQLIVVRLENLIVHISLSKKMATDGSDFSF